MTPVIRLEGTETSADGDVSVHVGPVYSKWTNLAAGHWVQDSVLAPVNGQALPEADLQLDCLHSAGKG